MFHVGAHVFESLGGFASALVQGAHGSPVFPPDEKDDQDMSPENLSCSETSRRWWALGFVLGGYLAVFAGVTIMNVALPEAQEDLGFSDATRQGVLSGYALSFGALMVPAGRLGDLIGLVRCYIVGITGFAVASLLGGMAGNVLVLLVSRVLQGACGALVAATGLALLSLMFPQGPARARAFGILGTVMGLGTAVSFVLAGTLVDGLSWRWTVLINIPVAIIVVTGLLRTAPPDTTTSALPAGTRFDLVGAVLVVAVLALLVTGFDRAGATGWTAPETVWLVVAGALGVVFLVGWLRRAKHPLIPLSLVADPQRAAAFVTVFVGGTGMFAGMYFLTNYLQGILGYSAIVSGLSFLPFGAGAIAVSSLLGTVRAARLAPRKLLVFGLLATAAALSGFCILDPGAGYTPVLAVMLLLGAGGTTVMVTGAGTATLGAEDNSGVAGALTNAGQQMGAALGTALLTAVASRVTAGWTGDSPGPQRSRQCSVVTLWQVVWAQSSSWPLLWVSSCLGLRTQGRTGCCRAGLLTVFSHVLFHVELHMPLRLPGVDRWLFSGPTRALGWHPPQWYEHFCSDGPRRTRIGVIHRCGA